MEKKYPNSTIALSKGGNSFEKNENLREGSSLIIKANDVANLSDYASSFKDSRDLLKESLTPDRSLLENGNFSFQNEEGCEVSDLSEEEILEYESVATTPNLMRLEK